jgi:hypothetical protein
MNSNDASDSAQSAVCVAERPEPAVCVAELAAADAPQDLERLRQQPVGLGSRISRGFRQVAGARRPGCAGYDSSLADPDRVENDYYRFLNHPRD